MNMKFQHRFMHLLTFGKTDRAALQTFEARAKIEVPPLNSWRPAFVNPMLFRRQILAVRRPIIRVKSAHQTVRVLLYQAATTRIGAAAEDERRDLFPLPIQTIPAPVLPLFRLKKRPEFIDFQVLHTPWGRRFSDLGGSSANRL